MRITHKSKPKTNKVVREIICDLSEFLTSVYQHNAHVVKWIPQKQVEGPCKNDHKYSVYTEDGYFYEIMCNIDLSTAYCLQGLTFSSSVPSEGVGLLATSPVDR